MRHAYTVASGIVLIGRHIGFGVGHRGQTIQYIKAVTSDSGRTCLRFRQHRAIAHGIISVCQCGFIGCASKLCFTEQTVAVIKHIVCGRGHTVLGLHRLGAIAFGIIDKVFG